MPVPGLSLLGTKRIRGFVSILRYINPTITIDHIISANVDNLNINVFTPDSNISVVTIDQVFNIVFYK